MPIKNALTEKFREAIASVLPIALIVIILCFTVTPVSNDLMLSFIIGTVMLVAGLSFFTFGVDQSMSKIGSLIGSRLTHSKSLPLILSISFILGLIITIAEPDLQVLAGNVPHINSMVLILTVSVGVGLFLMFCMIRILANIQLRWVLLVFYGIVFLLAGLSDPNFLCIAFDSGGVTTGPMTVPFIMALGVGVAGSRSDRNAQADSFGLVALCSIGPILAVLILGFLYNGNAAEMTAANTNTYADTLQLGIAYYHAIPEYMLEVAVALAPIIVFFFIFQLFLLKLRKMPLLRILLGLLFTYAGLVLFLTGVNVGFSSLGVILGQEIAEGWMRYLLIPIAMLMGWFIVQAEPAIHVLTKQVEEVSSGAISAKAIRFSLSIAIALAMGLAMVRVLTGIHIFWFLIPGYLFSLVLTFFVPQMFTAIAFDSGGVASGPMTATFMLPFAMGACQIAGGNILTDAFGLVSLVAMMPLITIQLMGAIYLFKSRKQESVSVKTFDDNEIIELWEV